MMKKGSDTLHFTYDAETGFYYLQSRYYNPQTGRFLSADVAKPLSILSGNVPAKMDVYGRLSKTDINRERR